MKCPEGQLSHNSCGEPSRQSGKPLPETQEGRTQLLNRCERELHFSLDPSRARDPEVGSGLDRVLEHRGLTDPRLAMHHQHAATPGARSIQQPVEHLALAFPAEQGPS